MSIAMRKKELIFTEFKMQMTMLIVPRAGQAGDRDRMPSRA